MSNFVVNLNEPPKTNATNSVSEPAIFENQIMPKKPSGFLKALKIISASLALFMLVGAIAGYFYWRNLKTTPQYSLALLVDAARRDDQAAVEELVDTNAVVDDFMPQITDKAVELYGRGLAPATIQKVAQAAAPLLPVVKQRARLEVPNLIREKTKSFEKIPFWAIAVGAERYVEIIREGDKSFVRSRQAERPFEVVMKKNGERWQVVGIKDEALARGVAERVGQDLIAAAKNGNIKKAGEQLGLTNLDLEEVLKKADDIFK